MKSLALRRIVSQDAYSSEEYPSTFSASCVIRENPSESLCSCLRKTIDFPRVMSPYWWSSL
jgi:hypothetical protein